MSETPFRSKNFIANKLLPEEAFELQRSLLNKVVKIKVIPQYGFFTEEGFPVALAIHRKFTIKTETEFYAKIIEVEPMLTIYEVPEKAQS